jgi:hypothetical protein
MVKKFEETLIKLLYRCLIAWTSIHQCQKIFTLNTKKEKFLENFINSHEDGEANQDKLDKSEKILAQYCLQSSRIHVQINNFLEESNFFKGSKFKYEKGDMKSMLRKDIKMMRN